MGEGPSRSLSDNFGVPSGASAPDFTICRTGIHKWGRHVSPVDPLRGVREVIHSFVCLVAGRELCDGWHRQ